MASLLVVRPIGLRTALPKRVAKRSVAVKAATTMAFDSNWAKLDPTVFALGLVGWTIPSSLPIHAFHEQSLFGLLTSSIGSELAHFPQGPALNDDFWLYMFTWHIGLFVTLTFGQIGVQGKKQGYWS